MTTTKSIIRFLRSLIPDFTLIYWQLRQSWQLLILTGLGTLAALIVVCTIPLYSRITLTAGLHSILEATPNNTVLAIHGPNLQFQPDHPTSQFIISTTRSYNQTLQREVPGYLHYPLQPDVILQTPPYVIMQQDQYYDPPPVSNQLSLQGYDLQQVKQHIHLVAGSWPEEEQGQVLEILVPRETADGLGLHPGSHMKIELAANPSGVQEPTDNLSMVVAGVFASNSSTDLFWHDNDFRPSQLNGPNTAQRYAFQALAARDTMLRIVSTHSSQTSSTTLAALSLWTFNWYYQLDTRQMNAQQIDSLMQGLSRVDDQIQLTYSPFDLLKTYKNRTLVVQLPTEVLLALITGMVLLFVGLTSSLLVYSQLPHIALLTSRGAERRQIMSIFLLQQAGMILATACLGPVLAVQTTRILAHFLLSASDQGIATQFLSEPLQLLPEILGFVLITAATAIATTVLAIYQATRIDVLLLRRRQARQLWQPFWQRYYLDLFAALGALSSYSLALYEMNTGALSEENQAQLLAPLILVAAILTIFALLLLLLRTFPFLLTRLSILAARSRSATPTLAITQLARAPQQALSTTILLSLTTAFALFTLVFMATQTQRAADIATYIVGADFSGTIINTQDTPAQQTTAYRNLHGVISATVGYSNIIYSAQNTVVGLKAVDTTTFARSVIWSPQNSTQSLDTLMDELSSHRTVGIANLAVPAIIDAQTWNMLGLHTGDSFTLFQPTGQGRLPITYIALVKIQHIPTFSYGLDNGAAGSEGLMVDYQTYSQVTAIAATQAQAFLRDPILPNYFWLHTRSDPTSLKAIRGALNKQQKLTGAIFYDRYLLLNNLYHDPLYLNLMGILLLGACVPLALSLPCCLIATWSLLRIRLAQLVVLRAMGAPPLQILAVLGWEQIPLYLVLIIMGVVAGWMLSAMTLPALVVSSLTTKTLFMLSNVSTTNFTSEVQLPSVQMAIPNYVGLLLGALILICLLALGLLMRMVLRISFHKSLRLDND
ncbi:FtsX-like permease family protein [Tengunoibacter tsumagoiensis]|uniref:ABC3 transporter permease protein domain-containing protein n=1 Tax=Tengunoibacter tsumagoiensis TaxID=2014871 RepID=A0A401ZWY3_9CHLR|nr:FtsX-like permease family protein [Tengunoibacter tsumagoiensis]GCE11244.1 hypothetical protein KTT_11030 [Tengunoibacter tsumagoiensis]